MKKVKLIGGSGLLLALIVTVSALFFPSASTIDHADSQAIRDISAEMAKVERELTALKTVRSEAQAWTEPTLGQIAMFAGNFAPRGWALCNGQLLPVSQNDALFSLLGTIYGGDGRTTFGLPDLRGRVPVHQGQVPGLYDHRLGSKFGRQDTDIKTSKIPIAADSAQVQVLGGIFEHEDIRQPSLGVNYIIALEGNYPSRN